jgi:hypothetical protein
VRRHLPARQGEASVVNVTGNVRILSPSGRLPEPRHLPEPRLRAPRGSSASPPSPPGWATRLGLVCTFGPGLVIINTAGGEDRLELKLELPEEALAKALAPSGSPPAGCRRSWPCSAPSWTASSRTCGPPSPHKRTNAFPSIRPLRSPGDTFPSTRLLTFQIVVEDPSRRVERCGPQAGGKVGPRRRWRAGPGPAGGPTCRSSATGLLCAAASPPAPPSPWPPG